MSKRVTIRDIAAKLGYHYTTVSLALRHHSGIPKKTTDIICDAAKEMGYVVNPMLSAWMADVRSTRHQNFKSTLAYLDLIHTKTDLHQQELFTSAQVQAQQYGYGLMMISISDPSMTYRRINHILKNSGIRGVIIGPKSVPGHISLDWDRLACICIGHSIRKPDLHRIVHHQKKGMQIALRHILKKGYERVGFVLNGNMNQRTDYNYASAYAYYSLSLPARERIPIHQAENNAIETSLQWYKRWKPDCIISFNSHRIKKMILSVPMVDLDLVNNDFPGIDQQYSRLGATAVDFLSGNLAVNLTGLPQTPQTILIEGKWSNDSLLPPKR